MSQIKIKKKKPLPLFQKIFYIISFIFLISSFIYLGTKNYDIPINKVSDKENFHNEYKITSNNVYIYKTVKDINELLESGSAIVFMGFPENSWSSVYAELLNTAARNLGIKEIWYYNFKKDRANNNTSYKSLVKKLDDYLPTLDNETQNIYAPSVIFVKNGEVIIYDDETSIINGKVTKEQYWTYTKRQNKIEQFELYITQYLEAIS